MKKKKEIKVKPRFRSFVFLIPAWIRMDVEDGLIYFENQSYVSFDSIHVKKFSELKKLINTLNKNLK